MPWRAVTSIVSLTTSFHLRLRALAFWRNIKETPSLTYEVALMLAAHFDEPRWILLKAEIYSSTLVNLGKILRPSETSVYQWGMSRNWGVSLPHRMGSVDGGYVEGASIHDAQHQNLQSLLLTQQALVRAIGNIECCSNFWAGGSIVYLIKLILIDHAPPDTIPHH